MKCNLFLLAACSACLTFAGCNDDETLVLCNSCNDNQSAIEDSDSVGDNGDDQIKQCKGDLVFCNGKCIDLDDLHMDDCKTCSPNYCNTDRDFSNGCETYVHDSDMNNCGGCGIQCNPDSEVCSAGECVPICENDQVMCGSTCINLAEKHLESCTSCAADYCDTNNNLADGCEAYVKADDINNCGACGNQCNGDEICVQGQCKPECASGEISCGGKCTNLTELHLSECGICAENYCDADGNMDNGCEVNAKADDVNNCGTCGNQCSSGQVCTSGQCTTPYASHRVFVVDLDGETLNVRDAPVSGTILTQIPEFTYVTAIDEKDNWYKVTYKDTTGWISGAYTISAGDNYAGRKAIDEAEKYLYVNHPGYCTWDLLKDTPNFTNLLGWSDSEYNYGYNDNCANFVTAMLKTVGLIGKNLLGVADIYYHCNNANGYRPANFADAKPGDIWMNKSLGHTELVIGYHKGSGRLVLIGSNNFGDNNDYNTYGGCQKKTGQSAGSYQRVSYAYKSDGYMFTRQ